MAAARARRLIDFAVPSCAFASSNALAENPACVTEEYPGSLWLSSQPLLCLQPYYFSNHPRILLVSTSINTDTDRLLGLHPCIDWVGSYLCVVVVLVGCACWCCGLERQHGACSSTTLDPLGFYSD